MTAKAVATKADAAKATTAQLVNVTVDANTVGSRYGAAGRDMTPILDRLLADAHR
ncbi:MAG: hypothetical protein ACXVRK_00510 [Gaiellaceae bacterium]|jgi:hypothetical protein